MHPNKTITFSPSVSGKITLWWFYPHVPPVKWFPYNHCTWPYLSWGGRRGGGKAAMNLNSFVSSCVCEFHGSYTIQLCWHTERTEAENIRFGFPITLEVFYLSSCYSGQFSWAGILTNYRWLSTHVICFQHNICQVTTANNLTRFAVFWIELLSFQSIYLRGCQELTTFFL